MIIQYGKHLGGFKNVDGNQNFPEDLARISYLETQASIELQPEEIEIDKIRKTDELEHLGKIGQNNNPKEPLQKFHEAIYAIE
jgi:hypothetical protein